VVADAAKLLDRWSTELETSGARVGRLVEQLDAREDLPFCDAVSGLFAHLDHERHHPFAAHAAVRYHLRRGARLADARRVLLRFARVRQVEGYKGNPFIGSFAVLAMEHDVTRGDALELVRLALRSTVPIARREVAAALVVVDAEWCAEELMLALADQPSGGWADTAELRCALARVSHPSGRRVAERWFRAHGAPPHRGPGFSWDEVAEANRDAFFDGEVERARPRIEPLRAVLACLGDGAQS
jgi:hypothetical protein